MSSVTISASQRCYKIAGIINFDTVLQLREQGAQLIQDQAEIIFDFSNVSQGDSSAIALLLNWIRMANSLNKSVKFINVPQQLLDIATVCGVLNFLNINLPNEE